MRGEKPVIGGSKPDPTVRERALVALVDLVTERGLAKTSIDDIADRAGISKTTLYTRWPDRRSLVIDGFRFAVRGFPDLGDLSFREAFDLVIVRTSVTVPDQRIFQFFAEAIAAGGVDADIRAVVRQNHEAWRDVIREVIERGKVSGEVPASRDVDVATEVVMGVVTLRHLIGHLPVDDRMHHLAWRLLTEPAPY